MEISKKVSEIFDLRPFLLNKDSNLETQFILKLLVMVTWEESPKL